MGEALSLTILSTGFGALQKLHNGMHQDVIILGFICTGSYHGMVFSWV
jgi:hypothetical protein